MANIITNDTSTTPTRRRSRHTSSPATELRERFNAMRLSFSWLGMRKSLTVDQRLEAAEPFGAEQNFISAGKKLIDTGHPAVRSVNQLRRQVIETWRSASLPYPEPGIRLIRQDDIASLTQQMQQYRQQLESAVEELEDVYDEIKQQARSRLGRLYCASDYPASLTDTFQMFWEFPNVEPPSYLQQLSPELYELECQRMRQRFEEAVQLAEQAFIEELTTLVAHLSERLSGSDDGKPKVFRDSALGNLREFFERFGRLNISSSAELDELVQRAQAIVRGVQPTALRLDDTLRQQVASQLSGVQSVLDGLMIDRPRRRILRDQAAGRE